MDASTVSLKDLLEQQKALEQQINEARKREVSGAVAQVRAIVAQYGLTAQDVFATGRAPRTPAADAGIKVAPKYRDPLTGKTWTGRGKPPTWIKDKNREEFAI